MDSSIVSISFKPTFVCVCVRVYVHSRAPPLPPVSNQSFYPLGIWWAALSLMQRPMLPLVTRTAVRRAPTGSTAEQPDA